MMVPKKSLAAGMVLAGFAFTANAQSAKVLDSSVHSSNFKHATPVKHMVYDFANQKVVRNGTPRKSSIATFCYVNTDTTHFFTPVSPGYEYIDWGILGGTATTKCAGLSDIVSNIALAYATFAPDTSVGGPGAALTVTFYTNWAGFGQDSGNCPVATFSFTGMPGFSGTDSTGPARGYFFSVDLSGGFEFCLPDGRFGYGYRSTDPYQTGPLLCLTGDGAGGPEPCTGNEDAFEIWVPNTKGVNMGTMSFGGPPNNFSSFFGQVARADLSGSPATVSGRNCPPNKVGSLVCSTAELGGTLSLTCLTPQKAVAIVFAFDTPFKLTLSGGQVLLCLDFGGNGELLTGGGFTLTPQGIVGLCPQFGGILSVPENLDLCGFTFCAQAIMFGPPPFALSAACDFTIGG